MVSVGLLPTPFFTACPSNDWRAAQSYNPPYSTAGTCLNKLFVYINLDYISKIAVDFASRGKVGPAVGCGGADTYVTFDPTSPNEAYIDVWKAYADGVWTSSTTVKIYGGRIYMPSSPARLYVARISSHSLPPGVSLAASTDTAACGTTLQATVTVNDNGTFSIA
jgi:hypothetical protein